MQLLPVALVLVAVIVLLSSLWAALSGKGQEAFLGAVVGSTIAFCGALLLQYLGEVVRSWTTEDARDRREAGIISALMSELGEAAVALEANAANKTTFPAPTDQWLTLRLQVGELWTPNTVFRYSSVYVKLKLLNGIIDHRAASMTSYSQEQVKQLEDGASQARKAVESLRRRISQIGRD